MTIDDLSHENSLIRARNERLEAEKVGLLIALMNIRAMAAAEKSRSMPIIWNQLDLVISGLTGSAT
jgi:hypothetical protein